MTATPAWPPRSTPRLFIDALLDGQSEWRIDGPQAHYLLNVMRMKAGSPIKLFDDRSGEYLAQVEMTGKRDLLVRIEGKLRAREAVPDLWLLAAPIKKARIDWLAEKICELGVDRFCPVITQRTVIERIKTERLRAHFIEAAEQCGRTALPQLDEATPLNKLIAQWPIDRTLYFADEAGAAPFAPAPGAAAILIGPEGGFTDEERALVRALPLAVPMSLGPRILRAETAALSAIAVWMAMTGNLASI